MALHHASIIELRGVSRAALRGEGFSEGELREVHLALPVRTCTWLAGPAGGGKDLLFRLLSLAEMPDAGEMLVEGTSQQGLTQEQCAEFRAHKFGFIAATPFLIPTFSAIENIAVPLMKVSRPTLEQAQERIAWLLRFVQLEELAEAPASTLGPLDQARLVLARALSNGPIALFVEDLEPLLGPCEALLFAALLRQSCATFGVTTVAMEGAHSCALAGDQRVEVNGGRVALAAVPAAAAAP